MDTTSLGDRMKTYENSYRIYLPKRLPVILRVDGRAFHTFTRAMDRPFDTTLHTAMVETTKALCKEISGTKFAYTQSDEISLLITNDDTLETQPWFDNNLQKIVSIAAAKASVAFNAQMSSSILFDARAFILPEGEVNNYFYWRQQDATRNSIQMAAHTYFPHKECQGKNCDELQEMLFAQFGINWNNYAPWQKRGTCVVKEQVYENPDTVLRSRWVEVEETPQFNKQTAFIENHWRNEE